jgi:peptidoglycan/xylan/chitin deacetylase (PgdA/CDA1 family)
MFTDWMTAGRGYLSGWKRGAVRRRGVRVFRYHGVVERWRDPVLDRNQHVLAAFQAQMDYLRRFRLLNMTELVAELEAPEVTRSPTGVITFDDGFANNLLAADLLARRRIPWCLFVPSGEVGNQRAMWLVEVSLLLMRGRADRVDVLGGSWPLRNRPDRERSFKEMRRRLKAVPALLRRESLASLRAQFPAGETDRLLAESPWLRILTWNELSQLCSAGVEIGSHGLYHETHHARQPADVREEELVQSRVELAARLGKPCRAFAYPNGDFVAESAGEAERAGYEMAFTTTPGAVDAETRTDRFLLPRLSAPSSLHGLARSIWWEDAPSSSEGEALRTV